MAFIYNNINSHCYGGKSQNSFISQLIPVDMIEKKLNLGIPISAKGKLNPVNSKQFIHCTANIKHNTAYNDIILFIGY